MSYSLAFSQAVYLSLYVASKVEQKVYDFIPTQKISQDLNIPASTAAMILRRLNQAGLIETREGANGGVRLARAAEKITILDIFAAIEQERPLFQQNVELAISGEKTTRVVQAVTKIFQESEAAMKERLAAVTIRDLMNTVR